MKPEKKPKLSLQPQPGGAKASQDLVPPGGPKHEQRQPPSKPGEKPLLATSRQLKQKATTAGSKAAGAATTGISALWTAPQSQELLNLPAGDKKQFKQRQQQEQPSSLKTAGSQATTTGARPSSAEKTRGHGKETASKKPSVAAGAQAVAGGQAGAGAQAVAVAQAVAGAQAGAGAQAVAAGKSDRHRARREARRRKQLKGARAVVGAATAVAAAAATAPPKATFNKAFSSNWQTIKQAVGADGSGKKRRAEMEAEGQAAPKKLVVKGGNTGVTAIVAMDCEMVGVGPEGTRSALARVCIINDDGHPLMDAYVKPKEKVTDYRTWVSGVLPEHLHGEGVLTLEEAQEKVSQLLAGAILVGHSLQNDLKALLLDHPRKDTRDTGKYPPLMRSPAPGRKPRPRALRHLAREQLGLVIQEGEHSPVDDARAALYVYHKHRKEWEHGLATGGMRRTVVKDAAARRAVRESLEGRATTGAGVRKARMGKGKGQVRIAQDLAARAGGKVHAFDRDIKDDPYADL